MLKWYVQFEGQMSTTTQKSSVTFESRRVASKSTAPQPGPGSGGHWDVSTGWPRSKACEGAVQS